MYNLCARILSNFSSVCCPDRKLAKRPGQRIWPERALTTYWELHMDGPFIELCSKNQNNDRLLHGNLPLPSTKHATSLSCFTTLKPAWGISDLSRNLGIPKSGIFRIVKTFERKGFLRRKAPSTDFELGYRIYWDFFSGFQPLKSPCGDGRATECICMFGLS